MSYAQAVKWSKKHPNGTRQPVIFSTGRGFTPSIAFMREDYFPYVAACKKISVQPVDAETFYKATLGGCAYTKKELAQMTKTGALSVSTLKA